MSVTVYGDIIFIKNKPEDIPKGSYLVVKFEDVSFADAPSKLIKETITDAHGAYGSHKGGEKKLSYSLTFQRPVKGRSYSVSAVLNMGWKATGDSWIQRGDYLNDTVHSVELEDNVTEYKKDIEVIHYT